MCGSDTLTTVVSSTSMKVANITDTAMSHGLICFTGADISLRVHRGNDRHPGAQLAIRILPGVEHDLHRDALNDFDEIAGRIFRRQQAEARAGCGRDALHVSVEFLAA